MNPKIKILPTNRTFLKGSEESNTEELEMFRNDLICCTNLKVNSHLLWNFTWKTLHLPAVRDVFLWSLFRISLIIKSFLFSTWWLVGELFSLSRNFNIKVLIILLTLSQNKVSYRLRLTFISIFWGSFCMFFNICFYTWKVVIFLFQFIN